MNGSDFGGNSAFGGNSTHYCKYESKIEGMDNKLDTLIVKVEEAIRTCNELKEAQVGSANGTKRGNNVRFEILENWRASVNKVLWALFITVLGIAAAVARGIIIKGG